MQSMQAAIYTGLREIELKKVAKLPPEPGYVLLDTKQTGICGTDLHNYLGHWPPSDTFAQGHETCGVIAQVGDGVAGFAVGDRVVVECLSHCGYCDFCLRGAYNLCLERKWISHNGHGGFSEYTTAHHSGLFKIPEKMTFEDGALVEPLAVAYRAVAQAKATFRDRIVIIGGGTIGLLCLAVAKVVGVKQAIITVKYSAQAKIAREFGADHIVDVGKVEMAEAVLELTNGKGADAVIETVGGARNFDGALASVRKGGSVVLVAGYHEPAAVNLWPIVWNEINVKGSICYSNSGMDNDFQAAIDLISTGKVPAGKLITHRYALAEINEAFAIAANKQAGTVKVHIVQ